MPIYHVTHWFVQDTLSWREQWFTRQSTLDAGLAAGLLLAQQRYAILGAGVSLYKVTAAQVGRPRAARSALVGGMSLTARAGPAVQAAEIRLTAGPTGLYRKTFLLRGLPADALLSLSGVWRFHPAYQAAISAWLDRLTSGSWCLQCWGRDGRSWPVFALVPLGTVPPDLFPTEEDAEDAIPFAEGTLAVVGGTPLPPEPNPDTGELGSVRVGGAVGLLTGRGYRNGLNGEGPLLSIRGSLVCYAGSIDPLNAYVGSGQLTLRPRLYVPITRWTLHRLAVKAVGKARADAVALTASPATEPTAVEPQGPPVAPEEGLPNIPASAFLVYGTPPGHVPVPPPPSPTPPPPPPPPGPYVPTPIPPRAVTLRHLGDVAQWSIQAVAGQGPGPEYTPILIGQVLNLENTWWVSLYGQQPVSGGTAGSMASIAAGIHYPTAYLTAASNAVEKYVPGDAKILLYGYSLGGIIAELLMADSDYTDRIVMLVTLASPLAGVPWVFPPITRFRVDLDWVPDMTPLSWLTYPLNPILGLWKVLPADPSAPRMVGCHTQFPLHPGLVAYDTFGILAGPAPQLVVAPLDRLPVPPLT